MSEVTIDLSRVVNAINQVSRQVSTVDNNVRVLHEQNVQLQRELNQLRADFQKMIQEQREQAAFQRAITEVIRVRNEVEEKFGVHKRVRDNMLGILQAADLSLIRENTISTCTEELMLNAPSYWLAPSLVALAAWISNNESLAKRAVKEAVRRDREKTCLLFALICRRNGRADTCFEWLNEYFKLQSPDHMRKSICSFMDAYLNGVFGEDKDNVCRDHIDHWMQELKDANPDFDKEQVEYWKNYFSALSKPLAEEAPKFKVLQGICHKDDYANMEKFIRRIKSVDGDYGMKMEIYDKLNAEIDSNQIVQEIDAQLYKLVTEYEEAEAELREEEELLELIKKYKGKEDLAKREFQARKARNFDAEVNFVERLSQSVVSGNAPASQQKTAIFFLKDYIKDAFAEYIEEHKDIYPEEIRLAFVKKSNNGTTLKWSGKTKNGENEDAFVKEINTLFDKNRDTEKNATIKFTGGQIAASIFTLGIAIIFIKKKKKNQRADIDANYDSMKKDSLTRVKTAVSARKDANSIVENFLAQEDWNKININ